MKLCKAFLPPSMSFTFNSKQCTILNLDCMSYQKFHKKDEVFSVNSTSGNVAKRNEDSELLSLTDSVNL